MKLTQCRLGRMLGVVIALIACSNEWFPQQSQAAVVHNTEIRPESFDSDAEARVKTLLKERLAALRELGDVIARTGNTTEIFRARLAVLYAELEVCEADRERLAVLQETVAAAKQFEAHLENASAAVSANTRLRARLTRIDAELGLERFKASLKAPAK